MSEKIPMQAPAENTYGAAPQEWKDYFVAFENTRKRVLGKIFSGDPEKVDILLARIKTKQEESFSSVEDPSKYLVYHKSIGSSIGPISAPHLDFDGEHSLLRFYEKLDKELA